MKTNKDVLAFSKIKERFENNYNELHDVLYYYMETYLKEEFDNIFFKDECENLIGIRDHEEIVEYILNNI